MNSVLAGPGPGRRDGADEVVVAKRARAPKARRRDAKRLAGSVGCLGAAALVAAQAASASFTGAGSVTQSSNTTVGDLWLSVPSYGSDPGQGPGSSNTAVANRIQLAINDLYPGQVVDRPLDLTVGGNLTSSITLTVSLVSHTDNAGSNMYSDTNGVKFWVQLCSTDFTESGSNPDYTESCGGTKTDVIGASNSYANFLQSGATCTTTCTLTGLNTSQNAVNHLRFSFKLTTSAASNDQGTSFTAQLAFAPVARSGQNK